MPTFPADRLTKLAARALKQAGTSTPMARMTAEALVAAEMEGLTGHGLSRVALYAHHVRERRVDGAAKPVVVRSKGATCLVDAKGGLAFPAAALAVKEAMKRAKRYGIAFAGVTNSHHMGAAAYHLAPVAKAGLIGFAFSNSPAAINAWGGRTPLYGTNPIAAVFPRREAAPVVVDLSVTEVTRGKIMLHAKEGKPIPLGWAVDKDGHSTTDAQAALTGSLAAIGGVKGTMLALVVELLCVALTGAAFGFENDSYFHPGRTPRIGHAFLVLDPAAPVDADTYYSRLEAVISKMLVEDDVRLPGARRQHAAAKARAEGIEITDALYAELKALAQAKPAG
ncbi:MAG: Ldh family oxidoreductase [Betaproteobacteria bacterium]|nr:Ldh family oxidoreductase [Betaproteobacteria bacterium]MDH3437432.1 Ldh family oxidoreductase [Betaproteobacteria bacterium]